MPTSTGFTTLDPRMYGEPNSRHSVHEFGHSFIPETHLHIPARNLVQDYGVGEPSHRNIDGKDVGDNEANIDKNVQTAGTNLFASDDATDDIPIGNLIRRNPPRRRVPGPALSSPYVSAFQPRPVPKKTYHKYQSWMTNDESSHVITKESAQVLGKSFFRDIESVNCDMDCSSVDLYLMHLRERLINKDHVLVSLNEYNTVILDTDVFISLEQCWDHLKDAGSNVINEWQPPPAILSYVQGKNAGDTMRNWYSAKQDSGVQEFHMGKLVPLVQLFPKVLAAGDFWDKCKAHLCKRDDTLMLKVPGPSFQQMQDNEKDCGPFALMYVERLITGSPNTGGNRHIVDYRRKIAAMIFDLCYEEEE